MSNETASSQPAPGGALRDLTGIALTTGRMVLAAPTEADIDAITAICQDKDIQAWTTVPSPYTRQDAEHFVGATIPDGRAAGTAATFGLYQAVSGSLLGMAGLDHITGPDTPGGASAEIGFWAAPDARGRGYMTEAVRAVCRWGFGDLGLARIDWIAVVGNHASLRVAEKAGFAVDDTRVFPHEHRGSPIEIWRGSLSA
jgi:RimJ/RimL family protein N-acetyltransferase